MKKRIAALLLIAFSASAQDLQQLYEKAYFLETAKGQTDEALVIYRQIAATEVTDDNRKAIIDTLNRMLKIYSLTLSGNETPDTIYVHCKNLINNGQRIQAARQLKKLIQNTEIKQTPLYQKALTELMLLAHAEKNEADVAKYQTLLLTETSETIHGLVIAMPAGSSVYLPAGHYFGDKLASPANTNIWIDEEITIKGADREGCVIEGTMDLPLVHACSGCKLTLDSLTLKSQLHTYDADRSLLEVGCTLLADNNGEVTVTNCSIIAGSNLTRSPLAIHAKGFSKANIIDSQISGFDVPVLFGDGSSGNIRQSIIQNELMTEQDTEVHIRNTIFHDSKYFAIGCRGGNLDMKNCLIINGNAALSISSGTENFSMSNSAVINCKSILTHLPARVSRNGAVKLDNNVFSLNRIASETSSLMQVWREQSSSECTLRGNIFSSNTADNWRQTILGDHINTDSNNTFWNNEGLNESVSEGGYNLGKMLHIDPKFKDPETGDFTTQNAKVIEAGHGLTDPDIIERLWKQYKETNQ